MLAVNRLTASRQTRASKDARSVSNSKNKPDVIWPGLFSIQIAQTKDIIEFTYARFRLSGSIQLIQLNILNAVKMY